ncbi:Wzt carbohydrate-binding domain-containing protein, partial [Candidatus Poribacteria bacterium]|nr:Wzt carbohydrate-binding domain-containing protein [Candidatus Poribacteria bacterium]
RISRASLTDEQGTPKTAFRFGEPLRIELESVPAKALDNFSYVVGIDNADGLRVATVFADDAGIAHSAREGETHRAAVTIRPNLAPGSYSVLLGVFKLDVVPRALHFDVTNVDAPPSITRSRTWGAVCLEAQWETLPAGNKTPEV